MGLGEKLLTTHLPSKLEAVLAIELIEKEVKNLQKRSPVASPF